MTFGQLSLTVRGTNNGSGCDILYDFGKSHNFVEFTSKREFYFIQPWMQFPAKEFTDECLRVSIELVHRFNDYPKLKEQLETANKFVSFEQARCQRLRDAQDFFHQIQYHLKNSSEGHEAFKLAQQAIEHLNKPYPKEG